MPPSSNAVLVILRVIFSSPFVAAGVGAEMFAGAVVGPRRHEASSAAEASAVVHISLRVRLISHPLLLKLSRESFGPDFATTSANIQSKTVCAAQKAQ
jgi:hypothetical protein